MRQPLCSRPGPRLGPRLGLLLAAALTLVAPATAALAATPTPAERQALLAAHNVERDRVNVSRLAWNEGLARDAEAYARVLVRRGKLEHSARDSRDGQGENLWMGTAGHYPPAVMVGHWAAERQDFRPGKFPDISRSGDWHGVGHYTQLVWRGTTQVGCAVASGRGWDYLVCRYSPPGNWVGERVY